MPALRASAPRSLIAALAVALLLSGCGGSGKAEHKPPPVLSQRQVQSLRCSDWQQLDPGPRAQVIASLRAILGGDVIGRGASGRGSVLTDAQARRLFDGYCRQRFARAFSLYKLYGQAAGFAGQP
jgi:hypothetical protein